MSYFQQPRSARQKHYEAVRAVVIDHQSAETVTDRFGYTPTTVYSLVRDAKAGKLELFPRVSKGPQGPRTTPEIQQQIIAYRRQGFHAPILPCAWQTPGFRSLPERWSVS